MTKNLVTPCCGLAPRPEYEWVGSPYLELREVSGYRCPGEHCFNTWDVDGVADEFNHE